MKETVHNTTVVLILFYERDCPQHNYCTHMIVEDITPMTQLLCHYCVKKNANNTTVVLILLYERECPQHKCCIHIIVWNGMRSFINMSHTEKRVLKEDISQS